MEWVMTARYPALFAALGLWALAFCHPAAAQEAAQKSMTSQEGGGSAGAVGQPAWHTVTGPEQSFTADLPAAPKYTATQMKTSTGSKYTMHQYLYEQGNVAYVVQTAIYPQDVNVASPRTNLQGGIDNAAKGMDGGKWVSVDWVTRDGRLAVDAVGERKGNAVRSFSTMKERRIFSLTYAGPVGSAKSTEAERFVSSLRLGK